MLRRYWPGLIVLLLVLLLLWWVRPIFHGLVDVLLHESDRLAPADRDRGDLVRAFAVSAGPDQELSKRDLELLTRR